MKRALLLFLLLAALLAMAATSAFYVTDNDGARLPFGTSGTLHFPNITGTANNVTIILDHTDLLNKGNQPHSAIDSHLGDGSVHFTESSISHQNVLGAGANTHTLIDSHLADGAKHYAESSIIHANIQGIGTNTHQQIDTHINSSAVHFTAASLTHDALSGAAGFQNHSALDAHTDDDTLHYTQATIDHSAIIGAAGFQNHSALDAHTADGDIHAPIFDNISTSSGALWSSQYTKDYIAIGGGSGFVLGIDDETTTASPVNSITFDPAGFTVTDNGGGSATVTNLGGTGGGGGDVIDVDTTCYVATTGSDTTGDGSAGTPYATPHKCLQAYAGYKINSDVWLTIEIGNGTYALTQTLVFSHPNGNRIKLTGTNYPSLSITGVNASSGSGGSSGVLGNWTITLSSPNTSMASIGDYLLVDSTVSGGTNPEYMIGVHKITNVTSSTVTVKSTHYSGSPSGAISATAHIIKSHLSFPSTTTGISTNISIGSIDHLAIVGPLELADISIIGIAVDGGDITLGDGVAVIGFLYGIYARGGFILKILSDTVAVSSSAIGIIAGLGGGMVMDGSIASGCAYYGFSAEWTGGGSVFGSIGSGNWANFRASRNGSLQAASSKSYGAYMGYSASTGGVINRLNAVLLGNTVNYSPALDVMEASGGYIQ